MQNSIENALNEAAKKTAIAFIEAAKKTVSNSELKNHTLELELLNMYEIFTDALKFEMGLKK